MNIPAKYWLERSLLLFTIVTIALAYVYVTTPGLREIVRPYHCLFFQATGLLCPACGGTRAMLHLLNGRLLLALESNVLAVLILPAISYGVIIVFRLAFDRKFTPADIKIAPFWLWSFLAAVILFWIIRNIPYFSFLGPLS